MRYLVVVVLFIFYGCGSKEYVRPKISSHHPKTYKKGEVILAIGERMALVDKEIIRGGCWNYIDTLYSRAGVPKKSRKIIFKGDRKKGIFAPSFLIKPGDWLYYINYSYNKIEHSGVFVRWHDIAKKQAVILSYAGESRRKPGRYRIYNIQSVYTIIRPK